MPRLPIMLGQRSLRNKTQDFKYQFVKDQFIAMPKTAGKGEIAEIAFYKVTEDIKSNDEHGRIKAIQLKKLKDGNGESTFVEEKEILLPFTQKNAIVDEVKTLKSHKKNGVTSFKFMTSKIQEITKQLQNQEDQHKLPQKRVSVSKIIEKIALKMESSQDDSSQEKPQKSLNKKQPIKEAPNKQIKVEIDSMKQQQVLVPRGRKSQPMITQTNQRGRTVGVINYFESQGDSHIVSQQISSNIDESKVNEAGKTQKNISSKRSSNPKAIKQVPKKYTKGKFNPLIQLVIEKSEQLESASDTMLPHQSIKMNNKELIRAARTGNHKLLENILRSEYKVSSLFERWAPERDFNALELVFANGDKKMLSRILQAEQTDKMKLAVIPQCSLKEIQTGSNDKFAYGVRTRKVCVARGGKEGNNALVYDISTEQDWSEYMMDRLLETPSDAHMFKILLVNGEAHHIQTLYARIPIAVRCGNYQVAGALIESVVKFGTMYGFNQIHAQVLTLKDASLLGQVKKASAIKKTTGLMLVTPVHCAAINPNAEFLAALLEVSNELSIMDEMMRKPVHYAAVCQGTGPLELLLKRGIDAREGDKVKTTPLMLACKYGRAHNVRVFIEKANLLAADLNGKNKEGSAAIHFAAQGGHLECIEELVKAGADVTLTGKGKTSTVILASTYGHLRVVKYLVENGGKILRRDKFGRSALMMAVRNGNVDVASYLLMNGAEFNGTDSSKNSCIHYAAAYGFTECIDLLIRAGGDQNAKNSWNLTPLSVALQKNLFGVVKALLNYESTDVNCKDDEGKTLVSSSLSKFNADTFEYIKFLIVEKKADITIDDLNGRTPLHYAALITPQSVCEFYPNWKITPLSEKSEIIKSYTQIIYELLELLISYGGNINKQDNSGTTPFMQALIHKNFLIAKRLIDLQEPLTNLVNNQDHNIIHQMAQGLIFMDEMGAEIFKTIFQKIQDTNLLLNQVDANGATPYLTIVMRFAENAKNTFTKNQQNLVDELCDMKLEERLKEEKKNKVPTPVKLNKKEKKLQFDEDEEEDNEISQEEEKVQDDDDQDDLASSNWRPTRLPFFQQTAAKQMAFPSQQLSFNNQQQFNTFAHSKTYYVLNHTKVVNITYSEFDIITQQALEQQQQLEDRFIHILQIIISCGADPQAKVVKLKKFRSDQYKTQVIEEEDSIHQNSSGLRGGARTVQTSRRQIGPAKQAVMSSANTNAVGKHQQYSECGKQTSLHMIFNHYPSISVIEALLSLGQLDLNSQDFKGCTPLMLFVSKCAEGPLLNPKEPPQKNQIAFFNYTLNTLKLNIHLADYKSNTPASVLAVRGLFSMLTDLCKLGATPNNLSRDNVVPLSYWVCKQHIENVRTLLKLSANPNFADHNKRTSLHHAVNVSKSSADASFEQEQLLIRYGAHADALDKNGRTPIFYAFVKVGAPHVKTEIDPFETVSSLCALPDCDVNVKDKWCKTPLHYAAQRGSVISGRYLIKMHANVDPYDNDHNTPLAIAFLNGHSNMATMLIDNRANVLEMATQIDLNKMIEEQKNKMTEKNKLKALKILQKSQMNNDNSDCSSEEEEQSSDDDDKIHDNNMNGFIQQQQTGRLFGGFGGFQQSKVQASTIIEVGQYSFFMLAIKHGWQGVAYLLISDGFDIQRAIQDAMNAEQFKLVKTLLMKVKQNELLQKCNLDGQNLFHIFAMNGKKASAVDTTQIIEELFYRGVDEKTLDNKQRSPLHYASESDFFELCKALLLRGSNPNLYDITMNTPFSVGFQKNFASFHNSEVLCAWMTAGTNLNLKFSVSGHLVNILLFLISEKNCLEEETYQGLILNGGDLNIQDEQVVLVLNINQRVMVQSFTQLGQTLLDWLISSLASNPLFQKTIREIQRPLDCGSYENVELLKDLSKYFDINQPDQDNIRPIDLANLQDSGIMKAALLKLGALDSDSSRLRRLPTSVVEQAEWPEEEVDYEGDSQLYLSEREREEKANPTNEHTVSDPNTVVDSRAPQTGQLSVVVDPILGPYSLMMTKVDVGNGLWSENVFYRMQVLHERNRDVYILFTRYGRIGDGGQFQQTPFDGRESAIKEFCKIFQQKSGNDWRKVRSQETPFEKQKGKYQLMNISHQTNFKQYLEPFDYSALSPYPECTLDPAIKRILLQFTQVKLYMKQIQELHIDSEFMPLERLSRPQLLKAQSTLNEINEMINEYEELKLTRANKFEQEDLQVIQKIKDDICERSSRYFELIPMTQYRTEAIPSLQNMQILNSQFTIVETLLQFEVTSKILLGAHLQKRIMNPLNYCFDALNIRIIQLPLDHPEYSLISTYIAQSQECKKGFVANIFAVERRGEAERFQEWNHFGGKQLLWHGSRVSNYMGILSQGLKVAPPWAQNTGAMFGKGIYFADMFQKSFNYCSDQQVQYNRMFGQNTNQQIIQFDKEMQEINKYKYMMLCEVALGTSQNLKQPEVFSKLPTSFQSVKALGRRGPNSDQNIFLPNGCKVPVGKVIDYPIKNSKNPKQQIMLQHNEYIVYNENQVRIRYMVQINDQ